MKVLSFEFLVFSLTPKSGRLTSNVLRLTFVLLFTVALADASGMEKQSVVVAKDFIKRGQIIKAEDIGSEDRILIRLTGNIAQDAGSVIDKIAKMDIRAGMIIKTGMLDSRKLVKRGNPVSIVVESGVLRVTAAGQAMEDGPEGKFIKVLNLSSRKVVVGKIVADSTVSVQF